MKKNFMLALVCSVMAINAVNAQTENVYYGSKQGGFAISVGANPVFDFVGNMFNGTTGNSLGYWSTISGKYFVKDNIVVEGGLSVENTNVTQFLYGDQNDAELVSQERNTINRDVLLYVGGRYLLRPGKRLQPSFGIDLLYSAENILGNNNIIDTETVYKTSSPEYRFGLNGVVALEYFFSKSISIGADLKLQALFVTKKGYSEFESADNEYSEDMINSLNYARIDYKGTRLSTFSELSFNFYF